jgi:hypothetical protein
MAERFASRSQYSALCAFIHVALLNDTRSVFTDICKRSARFIFSYIFSANSHVRFIARQSVYIMGHHSCVGRNISLYVVNYLVGHCPTTLRGG